MGPGREGQTRGMSLRHKILFALTLMIVFHNLAYRLANILSGFVLQDIISEEAPWLVLLLFVMPGLIPIVAGALFLPELVRWLFGPSPKGRGGGQDSCAPHESNDTPGDPKAGD